MPCEWLKTDDGTVIHVNTGHGGGGKKKLCPFCKQGRVSKLCDYPLSDALFGSGKTCDKEMCDGCARTLGRGEVKISEHLSRLNDTFDVCPLHRGRAVLVEGIILAHDEG